MVAIMLYLYFYEGLLEGLLDNRKIDGKYSIQGGQFLVAINFCHLLDIDRQAHDA